MKKIVIACDSFKGSLCSRRVADAAERGILWVMPDCEVHKLAVADGGEGTTNILLRSLGGRIVKATVCDPLMRPVVAEYGIAEDGIMAIMEMAAASGIALLSPDEYNPMKTSTYGTGQLIVDAFGCGCRKFLIGLGGSATNDGGTGMLRALGFRFLDADGAELIGGGEILSKIVSIDASEAENIIREARFTVACDVNNPLVGEYGAARIFAPQKGADPRMVAELDDGLRNFASIIRMFNGIEIEYYPGAGAAGGLGGGFAALLGAKLVSGIDMILEAVGFDSLMDRCDMVITGEGRMDNQTTSGKVPWGVLKAALSHGVPTVAITGAVDEDFINHGFAAVFPIQMGPVSLEEAMVAETAEKNIERIVRQVVGVLETFSK